MNNVHLNTRGSGLFFILGLDDASPEDFSLRAMEAAITSFFSERLYNTKDNNGTPLFISVLEQKVWVLADAGINVRIDPGQWQEIIAITTLGIREQGQCEATCKAISRIGELLKTHFPIQDNDINELHNIIVW